MSYLLDVLVEENAIDINPEEEMFVDLIVTSEGPSVELIVTDVSMDIVSSETTIDLIVGSAQVLDILEVGAPGPPGPQGEPGVGVLPFHFDQPDPESEWVIDHNRNTTEYAITIRNLDGQVMIVYHSPVNENRVVVSFPAPYAGSADLVF